MQTQLQTLHTHRCKVLLLEFWLCLLKAKQIVVNTNSASTAPAEVPLAADTQLCLVLE